MSTETVCSRKRLSIGYKQKDGQLKSLGKSEFLLEVPGAAVEISLASILHSVELSGRDSGTWERRQLGEGTQATQTQVRPRAQVYASAFPGFLCVCLCSCGCGCFIFCFSVSTGELEYGDTCDTFTHVNKAFSSFCRVQSGQHTFTL